MKSHPVFFILVLIGMVSCQKSKDIADPSFSSLSQSSGKSGGGGGGGTTTGFLQNVLSGSASRLIGGTIDSIWVSFTQPAPAGGWTLTLTSSDPSVQVPATYAVPQGFFAVQPIVTSSVVASAKNVTITVKLGAQTKSTVLKVFPLNPVFPAPALQTPGNGAGFKSRIQVKFTWSDNVNAYYHDIQISDDIAFTNPMLEVYLNDPIWAASYFNGLGVRYWRVRYVAAGGNFGPWSAVRSFTVKPQ